MPCPTSRKVTRSCRGTTCRDRAPAVIKPLRSHARGQTSQQHKPFIAPQEYFDLYPRENLVIAFNEGDLDGVSEVYQLFRKMDGYQN